MICWDAPNRARELSFPLQIITNENAHDPNFADPPRSEALCAHGARIVRDAGSRTRPWCTRSGVLAKVIGKLWSNWAHPMRGARARARKCKSLMETTGGTGALERDGRRMTR